MQCHRYNYYLFILYLTFIFTYCSLNEHNDLVSLFLFVWNTLPRLSYLLHLLIYLPALRSSCSRTKIYVATFAIYWKFIYSNAFEHNIIIALFRMINLYLCINNFIKCFFFFLSFSDITWLGTLVLLLKNKFIYLLAIA